VDEKPPSWRNTFNPEHRWYGDCAFAWKAAKEAGYPFLAWNGWIYRTNGFDLSRESCVCLEKELDRGTR